MTEPIADAIMDWIDPDSDPREFGAEIEYYSGLAEPYAPTNGPPETVEELLLVRDVTPLLLFGPDANRNGVVDPEESANAGMRDANGDDITQGWADYLTLYSSESNLDPDGNPRIDINSDDAQTLHASLEKALGAEIATFIIAYRQNGPYTGTKTGTRGAAVELDLTQSPKNKVQTVLELIGQRAQVTPTGAKEPTILETPFPADPLSMNLYLPALLDWITVNPQATIPARININEAPKVVLLGIPGMTPQVVDEIIAKRDSDGTDEKPERRHETWLMSEGLITLEQMKAMIPYVTSGGRIYRAQIVGFFEGGGPVSRSEVIVDASGATSRVMLWRDLTNLGRGYSWDTLGAVP
jgi:DNA uptake protein ComE-like DNA-binding protein